MKGFILIIFALIGCLSASAQQITGRVISEKGEPLEGIIYLKNPFTPEQIVEIYVADSNGAFNFKIENKSAKILFEIRCMGYATYTDSIINPTKSVYNYQIQLKPASLELEEVVISSVRKVVVKNDTTDFYPKGFLDGTERKVEDLLKRLPGMEVSENGSLKYMGKIVQSVQMNGDDLFGDKYAIGTKNIPVDLVEKVQAIDNFSENPLLKGIEDSKSVALNLVLKKTTTKIVADGSVGLGMNTDTQLKRDADMNMLAFNSKIKSFGTASTNNIGINRGLYDYFESNGTQENENKRPFTTKKILPEGNFSNELNNPNTRINSLSTASYNLLFRLNPKFSIKTSIYFLHDNIQKNERSISTFLTEKIVYDDQQNNNKKPTDKEANLQLKYIPNSKNLLVVMCDLRGENIQFNYTVLQNGVNQIKNNLNSKTNSWNNKTEYTYRWKENQAFQFFNVVTKYSTPQVLQIQSKSASYIGDLQQITNSKIAINNELVYFYKKKNSKLHVVLGNLVSQIIFQSSLSKENILLSGFTNDFKFNQRILYGNFNVAVVKNNLKFIPQVGIDRIQSTVKYDVDASYKNQLTYVFKPRLEILYSKDAFSTLHFEGKSDYITIGDENLYNHFIFEGNRTISKNEINLNLQKFRSYQLDYRYKDAYKLFTTFLGGGVRMDKNSIMNKINFDQNYSSIIYFRTPQALSTLNGTLGVEQFVSSLKTSVRYFSVLTQFSYKNIINDSEERNNKIFSQTHTLFFKTVFDIPFSIENTITFSTNNSKTNGIKSSQILGISNLTKLIYKPSQNLQFQTLFNQITPSLHSSKSYSFLDLELNYKPIKNRKFWVYEYRLIGRNLLNTQMYNEVTNTDYVITKYQSNLVKPFFLCAVSFRL